MRQKAHKLNAAALQISLIVSAICNVLFTIVKEESTGFRKFLQQTFYNAWLGQLVLLTGLFVGLVFIFRMVGNNSAVQFNRILPLVLGVSILILMLYYGMGL